MKRLATAGFSLLEIAMVLALMAIFLGFGMEGLNSYNNIERARDTIYKLEELRVAIDAYAEANDELPCPASKIRIPGIATASPIFGEARCAAGSGIRSVAGTLEGTVPVRALNLPDSMAIDSWNNKITYVVTTVLTNPGGYLGGGGTIVIRNGKPSSFSATASNAAYILISHGANGSANNGGATGAKETVAQSCGANPSADSQNCDFTNDVFYDAPHNGDQSKIVTGNDNFFDDFIVWRVAPNDL